MNIPKAKEAASQSKAVQDSWYEEQKIKVSDAIKLAIKIGSNTAIVNVNKICPKLEKELHLLGYKLMYMKDNDLHIMFY